MELENKICIHIGGVKHMIPIDNMGVLTMMYLRWEKNPINPGTNILSKGKIFHFGTCMWEHYMFPNYIGYVMTELTKLNRLPNIVRGVKAITCWGNDNTIEYIQAPSDSLSKLVKSFDDISKDRVRRGLRFSHIHIEFKSLLAPQNFELYLNCNGHYVNGSYVYDWEAAVEYVNYLEDKFKPLKFIWLDCDSSNNHLYSFKTSINMKQLDKHIDKMLTRVATKGLEKKH